MEKTLEVNIEKLVYGGDGLGRLPDGRAVFVPCVLPGERVRIELIENKERFARGRLLAVLDPAPERIAHACPHFGDCGGCHYQMIGYAQQLKLKSEILLDQLRRIGGLQDPPFSGITPSPAPWAYRNQVQFHPDAQGRLCFMDGQKRNLVPITTCLIASEGISGVWPLLDLPPDSGIRRLTVREDSTGEVFLVLEGGEETAPEIDFELDISASWLGPDGRLQSLAGLDHLHYDVNGQGFTISPESFFQVNIGVAAEITRYLEQQLVGKRFERVLELYAGAGLFSRFLAEKAEELIAVEAAPSSAYDFVDNLQDFENVSLYEAPVETALPTLVPDLAPCDLVFLDPPRAGLHPKAMDALLSLAPGQIIYLSCDPSTLARDLKKLSAAGYQILDLHAFDMFPQTYHIETIALLSNQMGDH